MNIYTINEHNFENESLKSQGIPIMLLGQIFQKISKKFQKLNSIDGKSIIIIEKPIVINTNSPACSIFSLSKDKNLVILDFNSVLHLSNNGSDRYLVSNELEFVSSNTDNPQSKFKTINITDPQKQRAFDWLVTNGVGSSAKSIVFHLFSELKDYYEQAKGEEFSFSYPHDTDDFSRCLKIINLLDLSKSQLESLGSISSEWRKLIDNYNDLSAFMNDKNYDEAYKLIKKCVDSSPKRKL